MGIVMDVLDGLDHNLSQYPNPSDHIQWRGWDAIGSKAGKCSANKQMILGGQNWPPLTLSYPWLVLLDLPSMFEHVIEQIAHGMRVCFMWLFLPGGWARWWYQTSPNTTGNDCRASLANADRSILFGSVQTLSIGYNQPIAAQSSDTGVVSVVSNHHELSSDGRLWLQFGFWEQLWILSWSRSLRPNSVPSPIVHFWPLTLTILREAKLTLFDPTQTVKCESHHGNRPSLCESDRDNALIPAWFNASVNLRGVLHAFYTLLALSAGRSQAYHKAQST